MSGSLAKRYHLFDVSLNNVVDVQIMEVLNSNKKPIIAKPPRSDPRYWSEIDKDVTKVKGLKQCISTILGHRHVKEEKEAIQARMKGNNNLWSKRPLSQELVTYCENDVKFLGELHQAYLDRAVDMRVVSEASCRYANYLCSSVCISSQFHEGHNFLPHNIVKVEKFFGPGLKCKGCFKQFSKKEFNEKDVSIVGRLCRVCRRVKLAKECKPYKNKRAQ